VFITNRVRGPQNDAMQATAHRESRMRTGITFSPAVISTISLITGLLASSLAQSSEDSTDTSSSALQEVVVSATRREESVDKVPISIAALGEEELSQSGIKDITALAAATPGLEYGISGNGFSSQFTSITIRGMNSNTGSPVVGIYLDDTPLQTRYSGSGVALTGSPYPVIFDLNRVEVARGPQGTLFGADSEAGTVRYITNQPSLTTFSGFTEGEMAETEKGGLSYELGSAVGGPIVEDVLGYRFSAYARQDGGYVDLYDPIAQHVVHADANTDKKYVLRGALTFQVDGIRVTPSLHFQDYRQGDSGRFYPIFSDPSDGYFANGRLLPETAFDNLVVASNRIEVPLSFADLTSMTSYTARNNSGSLDAAAAYGAYAAPTGYGSPLGAPYPLTYANVSYTPYGQRMHSVTQEVRMVSNQPSAFVTWVAGVYYDHRYQRDYQWQYSPSPILYSPYGVQIYNYDETNLDDQLAAYAQADVHLTSQWTLTLGERIAHVQTKFREQVVPNLYFEVGIPPVSTSEVKQTPSTPKIALSYQLDPNNLFYASAAEGFRIGGGNAGLASICDVTQSANSFKSDHDWSYEVGAKNGLFNGHLQADTSVFHILWYNIQQAELVPNCGGVYTNNIGYAVSNGFDMALHALVIDHLHANLSVGYANAHYTARVLGPGGNPIVNDGDAIGLVPQVNAPWNVDASATYEIPLSHGDALELRADHQYQSRNPGPFLTQIPGSSNYFPTLPPNPPTHLTNARLVYRRGLLEVSGFVNNVFNSHPLLGAYQDAPLEVLTTYSTFRPRTVGISFNRDF
jgi:iron complex outermembrane receptor protein